MPDANYPASLPLNDGIDFDAAGQLSILLHGAVNATNAAEVAVNCTHWRSLFPNAEIILSVSSSEILSPDAIGAGVVKLQLAASHRQKWDLHASVNVINEICDKIIYAEPALPLPQIKADSSKLNNANLLISSVKSGLPLATGRYLLRIRSDLIFQNRNFLAVFERYKDLPRGDKTFLGERVLISDFFTINPLTVERMPFHFSDWFNFGRRADVLALWDVPPVSLADALYYKSHPHAEGSLRSERLINPRLAVEQHITFSVVQKHFANLTLRFHNDRSCVKDSFDVLLDNFVICDMKQISGSIAKYQNEFVNSQQELICLTHSDWLALVANRNATPEVVLQDKVRKASGVPAHDLEQGFPRNYPANRFGSDIAEIINHELVNSLPSGKFCFGPYFSLPQGIYVARMDVSTLRGSGKISLSVTSDVGRKIIAQRQIFVRGIAGPEVEIVFEIEDAYATEIEVVCMLEDVREFAMRGVTVDHVARNLPFLSSLTIGTERFHLDHGKLVDMEVCNTASSGLMFFGPYMDIRPGEYKLMLNFKHMFGLGACIIKITANKGATILKEHRLSCAGFGSEPADIRFNVPGSVKMRDFEIACYLEDVDLVVLQSITLQPTPPGASNPAYVVADARMMAERN